MSLRVTVLDLETGDTDTATVADGDYVLICADPCYRSGVVAHANGTHVVTIKGRTPAPTPSEPVARCVGEHDWETRHPGDLAVCRRCWTVESDATPATRDE